MTDHVAGLIDVLSYRVPAWTLFAVKKRNIDRCDLDAHLCPAAISLSGSPSSSQVNDGGGDPVAEHRKDTGGPGRSACSMNVYCSSGTVSAMIEQ